MNMQAIISKEGRQLLTLVDSEDKAWGKLEKMEVHQLGLLHRAFSIFIFNSKGQLLLQKRAAHKYHSANLWTNTCCSHPMYGEETSIAVNRRLDEEMGMEVTTHFAFTFKYKAELENGLTEHELDHVYIGISDQEPILNKQEVAEWKYMDIDDISKDIRLNPDNYTAWFKICFSDSKMHQKLLNGYKTAIANMAKYA